MDSKAPAPAPEMTSLSSKPLGSHFSFPISYSHDSDDIDNSMKNYALEVDNGKDNGVGGDGGSENEGFESADDGFGTGAGNPVEETSEKAIGGVSTGASCVGSSDFSMDKSLRLRPVSKVTMDDDNDDENDFVGGTGVGILGGEEVEGGGSKGLELGGVEGSEESLGIGNEALGKKEVLAGKSLSENGSLGALGVGSGVSGAHERSAEFSGGRGEDNVLKSSQWEEFLSSTVIGDLITKDGKGTELIGEAAVENQKSGGLDVEESLAAREIEGATVAGAIVVADVETKDTDIKGMEVPVDGGMSVDDRFDQIIGDEKEVVDSRSVFVGSESDQIFDPLNKSYLEAVEVGIDGQKSSISDLEKGDDLNIQVAAVDIVAGDKQDNITAYPEERENGGLVDTEMNPEEEADSEVRQKEFLVEIATSGAATFSGDKLNAGEVVKMLEVNGVPELAQYESGVVAKPLDNGVIGAADQVDETRVSGMSNTPESVELGSIMNQEIKFEAQDEEKHLSDVEDQLDGSVTDGKSDDMIFGSSEATKQFLEELERGSGAGSHSGAEFSRDHSQRIDGQIVTDSDEEVDTDEDGDGKELFDSAALAALLKAATGAGSDGGGITITSEDGSRLFSVERPAGLGSSLRSVKSGPRQNRPNLFTPDMNMGDHSESNFSEEEKKKLEKLQQIRVKFLRLVQRLGVSAEESIAAQVQYRMTLLAGRQTGQLFSLEMAKRTALLLEAEGKDDLSFSLNILVLGKSGVGKSATINSIFGEEKTLIDAFGPATTTVKEIVGTVDGVKIRVFDTPGLKSSAAEQGINRRILSSVKKFTKKCPPDIVLYVDRLDAQTRDLNDLPLLRSIAGAFGSSIWRSAIITLTHAASAPPDGPSGSPLRYDAFVAQRSHVLQQTIGQAAGDLRLMNPSLMMTPVSLVENHPSCRKNREGQKILPNGLSWRPQLLLLCYSLKILSEVNNLSKPQDLFDHRKLFGFRTRSPPLPYLLSWLLQSRTHPKLTTDQGGDNGDSDIDLDDLYDSDQEEEEDEYDQLPPFKPLRKSQIAKLSKEQKKAYFEEYEYRVKLLQKKQWREELRRMKEIKKKGKVNAEDYVYDGEDDPENGSPAAVPVVLPDAALPPSFDGDNPAYRYRFLEPISQFVTRPVLDTHGWDHDCGYDGVNLEHSLALASQFPAAVTVQITKDKKEFNLHLDSAVSAKHGENGSSMAGFDIQTIGKQLAYIVRGETKFKNLKKNKTTAGISVTFLGENVSTGAKIEDQIALGKRLVLVGSTGTVRSQGDAAYGANLEVRLREADYPIGQDQSSLGLSLVKWRGDLALGANFQSQISLGRNYKVAVRAGLNNKLSGQITVRTSSSDQLQLALVGVLPIVRAIYKSIWPGNENYSIY